MSKRDDVFGIGTVILEHDKQRTECCGIGGGVESVGRNFERRLAKCVFANHNSGQEHVAIARGIRRGVIFRIRRIARKVGALPIHGCVFATKAAIESSGHNQWNGVMGRSMEQAALRVGWHHGPIAFVRCPQLWRLYTFEEMNDHAWTRLVEHGDDGFVLHRVWRNHDASAIIGPDGQFPCGWKCPDYFWCAYWVRTMPIVQTWSRRRIGVMCKCQWSMSFREAGDW